MAGQACQEPISIRDEELPSSFRAKGRYFALPSNNLEAFLADDLSVDRIEQIESHLWIVGRPQPPRPLNLQVVLNRAIIPTTDVSLHLVWTPGRIFVKTLPSFFFSAHFYEGYLHGNSINGPALGFLFTYISLIRTELDFQLAHEAHLISAALEWKDWKALSRRFLEDYPGRTVYAHLPERYRYGELRLGRLNDIYRYFRGDWLHGISSLTGTATYAQFFSENLGFVAGITVYIAVVLTAMQVGLATTQLSNNESFKRACYGFTVFAIVSPVAAVGLIGIVFLLAFCPTFGGQHWHNGA